MLCIFLRNLSKDVDLDLKSRPINPENNDLYERCNDGLVLCKLINFSAPNTIDERSLNKGKAMTIYQQLENLELALRSAEAIGCHVINVRPKDIRDGKEHLILGLLWQIIQVKYLVKFEKIILRYLVNPNPFLKRKKNRLVYFLKLTWRITLASYFCSEMERLKKTC